ncbi:MAG: hypothetical protein U5J99_06060 [Parvularculaceae bacterium]|nr:hypothetical protein [Parvularculaceae bacterium]
MPRAPEPPTRTTNLQFESCDWITSNSTRRPGASRYRYQLYPKLCAFRDEADPTSVYEVDPDNLAKTHGPGAKFLGLSIEIVDPKTPLTKSIEGRLAWIVAGSSDRLVQPFRYADDPTASLGQTISSRSFIQ